MAAKPALSIVRNGVPEESRRSAESGAGKTAAGRTLRTIDALQQAGLISDSEALTIRPLEERYQISVTPEISAQILREKLDGAKGSRNADALARQFVPDTRETSILPQECTDPIGDYAHAPLKALVHRHTNRVLLKATMICAVYCRFCFRRHMVGPQGDTITQSDLDAALDYIRTHDEITEIVLTGGDPLMLSAARLDTLLQALSAIPHIKWIRFHTRVPVVAPSRLTPDYVRALAACPKKIIMAIHANHAAEFTPQASEILHRLTREGVMLVGQSVLLKGVNFSVEAMADLLETMIDNHIKPYYLHHPDLTSGTAHFRFPLEDGMALMDVLRARVSGICMPQYTLDIPGGVIKIPINRDTVKALDGKKGHYLLRDPLGNEHLYCDTLP